MPDPITVIESTTLVLEANNIDTDQIVPARFLTTTSREGLADAAFADWRGVDSPLCDPRASHCRILVAGANFGCGSSREHAPWALIAYGVRCVVSTSFADIFRSNAIKNGLLPVIVPEDFHRALVAKPWSVLRVDLGACTCSDASGATVEFDLESYERDCLMNGRDDFDQLMMRIPAIRKFEEARR